MKTIDTDKLKGITEYYECDENTKVIKMFWKVFENLADEDKTLYLKFAWGRSRMPFDCSTLRYKHTLCLCEHWDKEALPESHTCFFQTDIANYETEEMLEKKLLTSIRFCGDIDNDWCNATATPSFSFSYNLLLKARWKELYFIYLFY